MKRYYLLTFGCQMNARDSELIAGVLEQLGYGATQEPCEADIIIVLTCCVRESAEGRAIGRISQLKPLKKRNPSIIIGVGGCMVQSERSRHRLMKECPHVDFFFGTRNIPELARLIQEAAASRCQPIVDVGCCDDKALEAITPVRRGKVSAWVTISYGCNNFCSYCIVPYVRGPERSRDPKHIIDEVKVLASQGYKEVTLLGQNVNSYGKDLANGWDFAKLLEEVNGVEGIKRIRFVTSHPKDVSQRLIDAMASLDKVCEHIHLPLQAGSNKVLVAMNRGYTLEHYQRLIEALREKVPGISITTDLIVGFPGETEEDFSQTIRALELVRFDAAFTFMYSPRPGTGAAVLPDQVPFEVKRDRLQRVISLQKKITLEINKLLEGKTLEVLVEGPSERDSSRLCGRTRTNKVVVFEGPSELVGDIVNVKITTARLWSLDGEMV
ncbi:MAG: tRNA (N6-isopentenyl adenosine(37)-C2)-methylthiotransferase MiaB [Bacillota bacterium]